jgi:hypothetical protein
LDDEKSLDEVVLLPLKKLEPFNGLKSDLAFALTVEERGLMVLMFPPNPGGGAGAELAKTLFLPLELLLLVLNA